MNTLRFSQFIRSFFLIFFLLGLSTSGSSQNQHSNEIVDFGVVIETEYGNPSKSIVGTGFILKGGYVVSNAHLIKSGNGNTSIVVSTKDDKFFCDQVLYIDRFLDLAVLKPVGLDEHLGLELFDFIDSFQKPPKFGRILKTVVIGESDSFILDSLNLESNEECKSWDSWNCGWLNIYRTNHEIIPGNSGSAILDPINNKVIGVAFGGSLYNYNYLSGAIISTEYINHIINHSEWFKPFSVNNLPSTTKIYSRNGTVIGFSNFADTDNLNVSGKVILDFDSLRIEMPLLSNLIHGSFKVAWSDRELIWLNYNQGKKEGPITIFSLLNYERVKGQFKNDVASGNWEIYNAYGEVIKRLPYAEIQLFEFYEDLVNELSTESLFELRRQGHSFSPSKFRKHYINECREKLQGQKDFNILQSLFSFPEVFNEEFLGEAKREALRISKL